jgi:hypothetical protein
MAEAMTLFDTRLYKKLLLDGYVKVQDEIMTKQNNLTLVKFGT